MLPATAHKIWGRVGREKESEKEEGRVAREGERTLASLLKKT